MDMMDATVELLEELLNSPSDVTDILGLINSFW